MIRILLIFETDQFYFHNSDIALRKGDIVLVP